jgi:triosephosphate isomerase
MSEHESGAYTGEISADMLESIDATGSLIGILKEDNTTEKQILTATEK